MASMISTPATSGSIPARCAPRPAARGPTRDDLSRAAALLAKAERPLILAGGGIHISEAQEALTGFAEAQGIPVAHTMSGKGAIACTHALSAGVFGRYSRIANDLIAMSDCLLVVGCKLGEIATKRFSLMPAGVPLIHLDVRGGGDRPHHARPTSRWSATPAATLEDLAGALGDGGTARRIAGPTGAPRCRGAWPPGARSRATGWNSSKPRSMSAA